MVKSSVFLNKRARHSALLSAMHIDKIEHVLNQQRVDLLRRVMNASESSYSVLCCEFISDYITRGVVPHNTLVGNIIDLGLSPCNISFSENKCVLPRREAQADGVTDSIRFVLSQHIRPGNDSHSILMSLTKSF